MGCVKCLTLIAIFLGIVSYFIAPIFLSSELPPLQIRDEWWGSSSQPRDTGEEGKVRKFELSVEPSVLEDLKRRLENSKYVDSLEDVNSEYGLNSKYVKYILDYWINKYDWAKEQARINSFPQYTMQINGLKVHYVHVKPKATGKKVLPLMLVHGWPGSALEFYNAIPRLTEPRPERDFVFEIICPHIPGFGFSEGSHKSGFNYVRAAEIFLKLMKNLGHQKYYLQGGDYGSAITTSMAVLQPNNVLGLHLNFVLPSQAPLTMAKWFLGSFIPQVAPGKDLGVYDKLYPVSDVIGDYMAETGYLHIQGTKPDTIGVSLSDSPAGLATYIFEIFASWTDMKGYKSKQDGGLSEAFTTDELITNVMIYWINNAITSSVRLYKESFKPEFSELKMDRRLVKVPSGFFLCDKEPATRLAPLGRDLFVDLINIDHSECGHFAALQKPVQFSDSVWNFVANAEKQGKNRV